MVGPNEETDIYCDLPSFKYDEILDKLQTTNKKLIARVMELEEILATITKENDKYRAHCENLSKNISSLFKTAQMEVRKKDNMIRDLNQKLICFRVEKYRYQKKRFLGAASQDDSTNCSPVKKKPRMESPKKYREKENKMFVSRQVNSENNLLVDSVVKDSNKVYTVEEKPNENRPSKVVIPNIKCHTLYSRRMFNKIYNINQPEEQKSCVSELTKSTYLEEKIESKVAEEVISKETDEISSISEKINLKKDGSPEVVEKTKEYSSETVSQSVLPGLHNENVPNREKSILNDGTACAKPISIFCESENAITSITELSTSNSRVVEKIGAENLLKSIFDSKEDVRTNCGYTVAALLDTTILEPLIPPINQKTFDTDIQGNIERNENAPIKMRDFQLSVEHHKSEKFHRERNNSKRISVNSDVCTTISPSKKDVMCMERTLQKEQFSIKDVVSIEGSFQQEPFSSNDLVPEEKCSRKEPFSSKDVVSEEKSSQKEQCSSKNIVSEETLHIEQFSSKNRSDERIFQKEQYSSNVISEPFLNSPAIQEKVAGEEKFNQNCNSTNNFRSNKENSVSVVANHEMNNAKSVFSKFDGSCKLKASLEKGCGLKEGSFRKEQFLSSVISRLHKKSCKGATISPISSQWNLTKEKCSEQRIKCESSVEINEKSSKVDIMESLFGSPVKWADNSADDSLTSVKMTPPLAAYEDSCSAQIENTRFKSSQENIDGITKLNVQQATEVKLLTEKTSVPDTNIPTVVSHSVNIDNIHSKNIDFDKSNESHLSFKENNCKLTKFTSFISHESSEACDVPSLSTKVNYSECITSRMFSTKNAKYHDSILGQFEDTTQLISALAKSHSKLSPINTPVKGTAVSPIRKTVMDTSVSPIRKAIPVKDIAISPIRRIFTPVKDAAISPIKKEDGQVSPLKITPTKCKNEKKIIFLDQPPVNILCPRKTPRIISRNSKQKETSQTKETTRQSPVAKENVRDSPLAKENAREFPQAKENAREFPQAKENTRESPQAKEETRELTQARVKTHALPQAKEKTREIPQAKEKPRESQAEEKHREYCSATKKCLGSSATKLNKNNDKPLLNAIQDKEKENSASSFLKRDFKRTLIRVESTPEKINLKKLPFKSPVDKLNHIDMNKKYIKKPKLEPDYIQNNFTEKMKMLTSSDISRLLKNREDWVERREDRRGDFRSPSRKENSPRIKTESSRFPSNMKNIVFKKPVPCKTSYRRPNCNYRHSSVERKIIKDRRHSLVRVTPIREVSKYSSSKETKCRSVSSSSKKRGESTKPSMKVPSNVVSVSSKPRLIVRSSRAEWGATSDVISTKPDEPMSTSLTQVIGNSPAAKKLAYISTKSNIISIKSDEDISTCQTQLIRNNPIVLKSPSCENSIKWVLRPIDFDLKDRSTSVKYIPTIRSPSPVEDSGVKKSTPSPVKIQSPLCERSRESSKSRHTPTPEQSPTVKSPGIVIVSRRRPARFGVSEISDKTSFRFGEDRS